MNIVFFAHPLFLGQQSMPRFVNMLIDGYVQRGHTTQVLRPEPKFYKLPAPKSLKKWLGYIDQFIVFPQRVRKLLKTLPPKTLFVFTDHALGPWVPLTPVAYSVIHCHDFLAQRSALGHFPENVTGFAGKIYQRYIRKGYSKGQHFISVSNKTRNDLHKFLQRVPPLSEVIYNGLNQVCSPVDSSKARLLLSEKYKLSLEGGYFLHVGGNDWYKNRVGVIELYTAWRGTSASTLPLLMIGAEPSDEIKQVAAESPYAADITFLSGVTDEYVRLAYSGATALLFPSLAEGFGWPIAEAMACGCPVITTNEAPMTEVGGDAAFYISRKPADKAAVHAWASHTAVVLDKVANLLPGEREQVIAAGIKNATRFNTEEALNDIEETYYSIVGEVNKRPATRQTLVSKA